MRGVRELAVCSNFRSSYSRTAQVGGYFESFRKFPLHMFGFAGKYNPVLTARPPESAPPGVLLTFSSPLCLSFSLSVFHAYEFPNLPSAFSHVRRISAGNLVVNQPDDKQSIDRILDTEIRSATRYFSVFSETA